MTRDYALCARFDGLIPFYGWPSDAFRNIDIWHARPCASMCAIISRGFPPLQGCDGIAGAS
jgi:hypothetical protein